MSSQNTTESSRRKTSKKSSLEDAITAGIILLGCAKVIDLICDYYQRGSKSRKKESQIEAAFLDSFWEDLE
jgi:hypothetical protein